MRFVPARLGKSARRSVAFRPSGNWEGCLRFDLRYHSFHVRFVAFDSTIHPSEEDRANEMPQERGKGHKTNNNIVGVNETT